MIKITIFEIDNRWSARVTQTYYPHPTYQTTRMLQRAFKTNPEAWQWAQRIVDVWKEDSA